MRKARNVLSSQGQFMVPEMSKTCPSHQEEACVKSRKMRSASCWKPGKLQVRHHSKPGSQKAAQGWPLALFGELIRYPTISLCFPKPPPTRHSQPTSGWLHMNLESTNLKRRSPRSIHHRWRSPSCFLLFLLFVFREVAKTACISLF